MARDDAEGKVVLYSTHEGSVSVNVLFAKETFWLTQKGMAELFDVDRTSISKHLNNIFDEGELDEKVVCELFSQTTRHGAIADKTQTGKTNFYNLDSVIAVGYRVNSKKATAFRIWATQTLRDFIIKGFALNDEMLKNGRSFGKDYFRELLERIRSIRASERRVWQQITDIFAECSSDYSLNAQTAHDFYATVQNKFHYAITGKTAAEIIYDSADRQKQHMGLQTWKNSPDGRVLKSDVTVAKNYLSEKEIKQLERTIVGYLDYIEDLIERENTFTMKEFAKSINEFLSFRKYKVLTDNGKVSRIDACTKAEIEYESFNKTQIIVSDFDKIVKEIKKQ